MDIALHELLLLRRISDVFFDEPYNQKPEFISDLELFPWASDVILSVRRYYANVDSNRACTPGLELHLAVLNRIKELENGQMEFSGSGTTL
jgi:hypothetical protein